MDDHHRIALESNARRRGGLPGTVLRCASWLVLSCLLVACGGSPADDRGATAQKLPIIVTLAVGDGSGADGAAGDTLAVVTARVMERLKAAMPPEDLAAVRTYGFLPAIALSADGALIARLLAMPEVQSIELDRELQRQGDAESDLRFD